MGQVCDGYLGLVLQRGRQIVEENLEEGNRKILLKDCSQKVMDKLQNIPTLKMFAKFQNTTHEIIRHLSHHPQNTLDIQPHLMHPVD
jgi:ABC-type transport system involved in cytochrome bd biosynthesis fused ATPase/permease subunit